MSANSEGIPEFFSGKNVLITGATGFLGKSLMEKLLRSCPDIGTIYIITRRKRGKSLSQRVADIIKNPLYDRLKEEQPDLIIEHRIKPLAGDIQELNLGLCDKDWKIITENVQLIFHIAATVRFDESLKKAILMNVRGTREICQIALDSKKLEAFIHISTAFANCDRLEASEVLYPAKTDWKKAIEIAEKFDSSLLSILTTKIIGDMPNTYCFSKNISEHLVNDMCRGKIPTKIVRPSIVTGALREPISGWMDNFYGPNGLAAACGKGVLRTFYSKEQCRLDCIPVDVVSKSVVVSAWDLAHRANISEVEIMQCTAYSAAWLRVTPALVKSYISIFYDIPLDNAIWLPGVQLTCNYFIFYMRTIIFLLMSLIVDGLLKATRNKPRLLEIQKKIFIAQDVLSHFNENEWIYPNDNLLELQNRILIKDRDDWDYEFMNYNSNIFSRAAVLAIRRYLFHEADDMLPKARRHHRILYWIDVVWNVIYWYLVYIIVMKIGVIDRIINFCK